MHPNLLAAMLGLAVLPMADVPQPMGEQPIPTGPPPGRLIHTTDDGVKVYEGAGGRRFVVIPKDHPVAERVNAGEKVHFTELGLPEDLSEIEASPDEFEASPDESWHDRFQESLRRESLRREVIDADQIRDLPPPMEVVPARQERVSTRGVGTMTGSGVVRPGGHITSRTPKTRRERKRNKVARKTRRAQRKQRK